MQQMTISSSGAFGVCGAGGSKGNESRMYYPDMSEI
jgi:hypothetical protein